MTEHIVKSFDDELDELTAEVARMGGLAEKLLSDALDAVVARDGDLAHAVIERDKEIDALQLDLERRVILLLALRQPMASDLRRTFSALKISGDLERIGDLAKNIAKRALILNESRPMSLTRSVHRMGHVVSGMLKDVLDAYTTADVDLAIDVWRRDDEIDAHYNSLFRELLTYMMEDSKTITMCTHLLFMAKNLERIGDHGTNIAENVHYLVTGEELTDTRQSATDYKDAP
ncbi:MAG: phosphate transport system regulatory protein PhoU [Robiginitomaculum sp.]|nr:MAG: phosphate transport system regulatory protein PhoU [Robiginitomaculum sp.]